MLKFDEAGHEVVARFTLADQGEKFLLELRRAPGELSVTVAGGVARQYIFHSCRNAVGVEREQLLFFARSDDQVAQAVWQALCRNPRVSLKGLGWSALVVDRKVGYSAFGGMAFF